MTKYDSEKILWFENPFSSLIHLTDVARASAKQQGLKPTTIQMRLGRHGALQCHAAEGKRPQLWFSMAADGGRTCRKCWDLGPWDHGTMGPQAEFLPRHAVAAISSSCKRFNHARSRWNLGRYQQNAKHSCWIFLQDEITRIFGIVRNPLKPIVDIFDVLLVQLWICKVRMDCPTGLRGTHFLLSQNYQAAYGCVWE